jgi:hypothetical protein
MDGWIISYFQYNTELTAVQLSEKYRSNCCTVINKRDIKISFIWSAFFDTFYILN